MLLVTSFGCGLRPQATCSGGPEPGPSFVLGTLGFVQVGGLATPSLSTAPIQMFVRTTIL